MMTKPNPPSRYTKTSLPTKAGAHGVIEIWHDKMLDRNVAIKWLNSSEGEEQLLNEWQILATAMSRHVVEIYELIFDHHGTLFGVILEHIDGQRLDEIFGENSKLDQIESIKALYQLASGLSDLHSVPIIHRDVKPENAVIGSNGRLKIVDFGLSTAAYSIQTARARSTFGYSAPEYYTKPATVSLKSDVYAFGICCWKLFTGTIPTVGKYNLPDASYFPLPSISTVARLPERIVSTVDACLQWQPEKRPGMKTIASVFCAELTKGRHEAFISLPESVTEINASNRRKTIKSSLGSLQISYDDYSFKIEQVEGEVFINNITATIGASLSEGCLIMFGNPSRGRDRGFAPFRKFTPEVVI
ncbi:serine/threonine-protein kinase [Azohydromonas lata]|uniref:Serine/threonine-protein kinase n=1 Tax=Azohydromonas lata TaxID=45677 RepID=A0ABU5IK17_9BURK|nr:serine/threonine-protein kinase [Azohydromonas lata]MDZ5459245.1 serine/threonine-protein kinase [Azohydromonas lata]